MEERESVETTKKQRKKYHAIRQGSHKPRLYLGIGPIADYWADVHAAKYAQWNAECQFRQQWHSAEAAFRVYDRELRAVWESSLLVCGFHRHDRGTWRRRRTPLHKDNAADRAELASGSYALILRRAQLGSAGCMHHVRDYLTQATFRPELDQHCFASVAQLSSVISIPALERMPTLLRILARDPVLDSQPHAEWLLTHLCSRREFAEAAVVHFATAMKACKKSSEWFSKSLLRDGRKWRRHENHFVKVYHKTYELLELIGRDKRKDSQTQPVSHH
jgi:hypothetical protein